MPSPSATPALLRSSLLAALLLGGCAATEVQVDELEQVRDLVRRGHFVEALDEAARLAEERPEDPQAELLHRDVTLAYHLAAGRAKTFEDRDLDALGDFEHALSLDPESRAAATWVLKTRRKLASRWYERARGLHASDNLEGARQAYETALTHDPDHHGSREGLLRVGVQLNYRDGLSDTYYNDGVRAITDWRLQEARHGFQGAGKYGGETDRVQRRMSDVNRELASQRVLLAKGFEERGLHTAARNEFRTAMIMDPENTEAAEGHVRAAREAEVFRQVEEARMWVRRGEFERGRREMLKALEATRTQTDYVQAALEEIDVARAELAYDAALNMEHDFRYEQAKAAYEAVIEEFGYELARDSQARITTLGDYIRDAGELYAEAMAAKTDAEKRDLLRQIEVFWPEYKDIQERLAKLKPAAGAGQ